MMLSYQQDTRSQSKSLFKELSNLARVKPANQGISQTRGKPCNQAVFANLGKVSTRGAWNA